MQTEKNMIVNVMPSPTWNWLKMNGTSVPAFEVKKEAGMQFEMPDEAEFALKDTSRYAEEESGMGTDFGNFVNAQNIPVREIGAGKDQNIETPVRLAVNFEAGDLARVDLTVEEGASLTVVMNLKAEGAAGAAGIQTRYHVGENAKLTIAQVITSNENFRLFDDIGGNVDTDGSVHLIQVVLSGHETYLGHYTGLKGRRAQLETDLGYQVKGSDKLDINYFADHVGRDTTCEINTAGVLRNEAFKVFRGTIDFKRGASGSVGREQEDVMLMDDTVINQTIPVILCTEESVEGTHGATIGRLDKDTMFYMESRGISEEAIYEMMARARIEAAANKIPDQRTREEISLYLNRNSAV